jgi:phage baseplate assembly protein W
MALSNGRHLAFPFRIGTDGRTAAPASDAEHVRDELLQLLLTSPGERLFLPEFGGGVRRLVFEPASDVLRGVVKARITQALSRWLGHRLTVELIDVRFGDEAAVPGVTPELLLDPLTGGLEVTVKYRPAGSPDSRIVKFQRTGQ